ncbi:MAG TPA: DNA polymerase Y family protein [Tepidisphaeraceae bacterium]|nr:DNA polymerase Y family protein [Tepidisphaeraceae bacterium]
MPSCLRAFPPLVLTRTVAERQLVVAASGAARHLGIRPGLTLTQARALHANVQHAEHDPRRDRKALEALGRWMMRFSPTVSACGTGFQRVSENSGKPEHGQDARATSGLFLDVTGCERLFHGLDNLVRQASDALRRMNFTARLAVAPTPGAAWAVAAAGRANGAIVTEPDLERALAALPPAALRVDDELVASLHHLGLTAIGQLLAMPREVLPARFGPQLLHRLDQALGRVAEPLVPLADPPPVEAEADFDGAAVSSLEAVWEVFQQLLGKVVAQLARRGLGARRLELEFRRDPPLPPVRKTIHLSRPSRDPVNLFHLFRCCVEGPGPGEEGSGFRVQGSGKKRKLRAAPGAAPADRRTLDVEARDGFTGLSLKVPLCEPLADEQVDLLGHEQYAGQLELDRLVERLRLRLGDHAVIRPELVEAYVPERGWRGGRGVGEEDRGWRIEDRKRKKRDPVQAAPLSSIFYPLSSSPHSRPLHLLPRPVEIRVMVSPSEDREGRPVQFGHGGRTERVDQAVGPERIAGQWWEGHHRTRDYFDVLTPGGRRFWIFRVVETARWYLHGVFE